MPAKAIIKFPVAGISRKTMDNISNPWECGKSGHILEFTLLPHHIVWDVYKITEGDQVLTWAEGIDFSKIQVAFELQGVVIGAEHLAGPPGYHLNLISIRSRHTCKKNAAQTGFRPGGASDHDVDVSTD
ncbi:hypothetical protein MJO28_009757 [Puccinia striiformis f. sp. tritici]|uniref:Uncharacterized protein n=2 Tax=Puccinia striiformis f. sp. tritici TaxID=168172 RepID=A0A0L0V7X3_9BASI|nr:hypothetical protein Pst134EB_018305 [Puccinia striiformis f. sp. tritici]KAI7947849.1 hypothetical protein MJO28_009757 [Puccinia striiformis f. sp. tritici]KAI9615344.1 hypothetical protein KEM48_005633 [Puccinia striiformis f. sp. tritici PST-130]KNE95378.1 hypothetical protein PSTG_11231 [Puccinia striiformis f. sp. tritici PST-78]